MTGLFVCLALAVIRLVPKPKISRMRPGEVLDAVITCAVSLQ